jgi:hypothetical protein
MQQIKRNSREFKDVKSLIEEYAESKSVKKFIRLYAIKPHQKLEEAVLLNELKKDRDALYNLYYASLMDHLSNTAKKLFRDKEAPFYYFKSSAKSRFKELPFEFTGKLKKQIFPLERVK